MHILNKAVEKHRSFIYDTEKYMAFQDILNSFGDRITYNESDAIVKL